MHATAIEKITPLSKKPLETAPRILLPAISFLLRWGLFALITLGVVLSIIPSLAQKWLWMRQLRLRGDILDPSLGQVGNLRNLVFRDQSSACREEL